MSLPSSVSVRRTFTAIDLFNLDFLSLRFIIQYSQFKTCSVHVPTHVTFWNGLRRRFRSQTTKAFLSHTPAIVVGGGGGDGTSAEERRGGKVPNKTRLLVVNMKRAEGKESQTFV